MSTDERGVLAIGAPFAPERTEPWPQSSHLWLGGDDPLFALFVDEPTPSEVMSVQRGRATFAWVDTPLEGYLVTRFDPGLPWQDCPYTPHREPRPVRLPELYPDAHQRVLVALVDAPTGITVALRALTWPARFANTVRATVQRLAAQPYSETAAAAAQDQLYAEYGQGNGTARWVRDRAAATCWVAGR